MLPSILSREHPIDFTDLLSIENIVFCFVCSLGVKALRWIVSKAWKNAEQNTLYRDAFLPVAPILIGIALAFTHYPIMVPFAVNKTAKLFFGATMGLLSAHVFSMWKRLTSADVKE